LTSNDVIQSVSSSTDQYYNVRGFISYSKISKTSKTTLQSDLFADVTPQQPSKIIEEKIHLDINGKEISVGSLFAIASTSNPIKAHSVYTL